MFAIPSFPEILQQTFNGLSLGAIYALIAIGYTMVYGIIGMINFAHGEIYMIGAYVGLVTLTAIGGQSGLPVALIVAIMLIAAMAVTATYGFAVERIAYRPVRGGPRLVALISAIGMSIFLQNWVALGQGARDQAVPSLISGAVVFNFEGFDVMLPYSRMLVIGVTVVLMVALTLFIKNSRMGRASRACSQDMKMASLLGIDTNKVISFTFVLGAVLAAVGGVLIAVTIGKLNPFIGFIAGLKAFTAAVLGGIGSIPGAMLGGVILGVVETYAAAFISSQYKDIVAFGLLVFILLFRPTGILGKPEVEKV
ncbi:high-affinity branched-chain amino acid ABC transporter permease LivH [Allofranklinella schreckenbergeri]|uniref:High-affinity branched-chain amino acid ABC transporter permease LivH n=1 Tax=Allofranklinella schreckenbergeri TaxID=1076744 RepID=A0A3M6QBM0_9BURK|nr:high-affinity branched-chain amino acid ABC transporter permease LivH [Allofranklinella schreckenbergeri]RMX00407.1 high-affinity branched-chain amino acid ABC transporter permease LivH [Allofranklinella schreckenbergeri]RMX00701.1 high-affinity branched-chain amino acid ABC transporter permease LivH [Allofranklinella schreckenbergeri]RMX10951.1 high-affinity branched-chain amino acid ABC transporter permease LivH [Allofranklinella schreckenbergeri]RRD43353.1 high-affinity branched-chain ami